MGKCCGGFIGQIFNPIKEVAVDVAEFVEDKIIEPVVDTVENIVKNPASLIGLGLSILAPGVGTAIGSALGATGAAASVVGNAVIGGTLAEASGGDFVKGALAGGIGSAAAPIINPTLSQALGSNVAGSVAGSALTGGTLAELQGGDFLQGALQGAVTGGINEAANQIKAYSAYTPNADGSYTYTWDDGSTITIDDSANVLGYTPSTDVFNATDVTGQAQNDVSGKLAALGVAKTLTPYALTALLSKSAYDAATQDEQGQYQYPIVPVPSEWKSPEYNMAFTPSAPINFGSPELLKGTQWENPVNLSGLINTLNQPTPEINQLMTQFQAPAMPYQTGINDIIGNLGGQPVSIADIISGIQSGQTYPSTMG